MWKKMLKFNRKLSDSSFYEYYRKQHKIELI